MIEFSEIELASDVKDFLARGSDVSCSEESLKKIILSSGDDELLKITKTIASPIKIIGVVKIDDSFIENNL